MGDDAATGLRLLPSKAHRTAAEQRTTSDVRTMGGCVPPILAFLNFVASHCFCPSVPHHAGRCACSSKRVATMAARANSNLQIVRANGTLLTRIEHNCAAGLPGCQDVIVYNHGFPDSSVVPTGMQDFLAAEAVGDEWPEHCYFASRLPRKLCEYALKQLDNVAFVAFNTRGVPGSSAGAPQKVEIAPEEFENKTLTGDLEDIQEVLSLMRENCPEARITICGMSTGAFLALAFAARPDLHPAGGVSACFTLACVHDIPSSACLDFSEQQRAAFDTDGFCLKEFFPYGGQDNPQMWKLARSYYDSYQSFPPAADLAAALTVPTLLLHGSDDRHVAVSHGEQLLHTLQLHGKAPVELVLLNKGNHFLSSNGPLSKALAAIKAFLVSAGASATSASKQ